jgi:hypothetical protein
VAGQGSKLEWQLLEPSNVAKVRATCARASPGLCAPERCAAREQGRAPERGWQVVNVFHRRALAVLAAEGEGEAAAAAGGELDDGGGLGELSEPWVQLLGSSEGICRACASVVPTVLDCLALRGAPLPKSARRGC